MNKMTEIRCKNCNNDFAYTSEEVKDSKVICPICGYEMEITKSI